MMRVSKKVAVFLKKNFLVADRDKKAGSLSVSGSFGGW